MKIFIQVKPNSKNQKIEKISENSFIISVKELPIDGKANRAVIKIIAEIFKVPQTKVRISSGLSAKKKILEIG